jgi:hypothetical protein
MSMGRRQVNMHSGVAIIQKRKSQDYMFQQYDATYPRVPFRNQVHIIGGNYQPSDAAKGIVGDSSPWALLEREIMEEFSPNKEDPSKGIESHLVSVVGQGPGASTVGEFIPTADMFALRDQVLQTARPFADYIYHVPVMDGKAGFSGVVSVYASTVDPDLFEAVRKYISQGKAVRCEGLTKLATADEVLSGRVPAAWWTRDVIGEFCATPSRNIHGIDVHRIGTPMDNWEIYKQMFEYKVEIK